MRVLKPIPVGRNPNIPLTDEDRYEHVLGDGEIVEINKTLLGELREVGDKERNV